MPRMEAAANAYWDKLKSGTGHGLLLTTESRKPKAAWNANKVSVSRLRPDEEKKKAHAPILTHLLLFIPLYLLPDSCRLILLSLNLWQKRKKKAESLFSCMLMMANGCLMNTRDLEKAGECGLG